MNITIISVGKLKEKYLKQGIDEYSKRLQSYCKLHLIEVPDEKAPENLSDKEMELIKNKEGDRILSKIKDTDIVLAMAIEGDLISSEQLAQKMESYAINGKSSLVFVIGGSLGLSDAVKKRANDKLSFGRITLPHQLMRLVLVEQVYRSFRITAGHAYHK